jgi:CheY-like chemotaxis protein
MPSIFGRCGVMIDSDVARATGLAVASALLLLAAGQDGCCLSLFHSCCGDNAVDNEYGLRTDAPAEHQLLPAQQQKLRILLVDDSADYVTAICAVLEEKGIIEVIGAAGNGIEAVEAVAELQPDLVIMDVQMPQMDGLMAASVLSRHFPATKIVLMSAEDSHQLRLASRAAGADAFVAKSLLGQDLALVLEAIQ